MGSIILDQSLGPWNEPIHFGAQFIRTGSVTVFGLVRSSCHMMIHVDNDLFYLKITGFLKLIELTCQTTNSNSRSDSSCLPSTILTSPDRKLMDCIAFKSRYGSPVVVVHAKPVISGFGVGMTSSSSLMTSFPMTSDRDGAGVNGTRAGIVVAVVVVVFVDVASSTAVMVDTSVVDKIVVVDPDVVEPDVVVPVVVVPDVVVPVVPLVVVPLVVVPLVVVPVVVTVVSGAVAASKNSSVTSSTGTDFPSFMTASLLVTSSMVTSSSGFAIVGDFVVLAAA